MTAPPSLRAQLLSAYNMSLDLLTQDDSQVDAFYQFWMQLQSSLSQAVEEDSLDAETLGLAHQVVSTVEILASGFLDLHKQTTSITVSLQSDLQQLFTDLHIDGQNSVALVSNELEALQSTHKTSYIKPALSWLASNIHNPYPSKEVRASITRETSSSSKCIDSWFIDARRRIGWSDLCRRHFSNKRRLIVEAATRFFKPTTFSPGEHSTAPEHAALFATIESRLQDMVTQAFPDIICDNLVSASQTTNIPMRRGKRSAARASNPAFSYPSPNRSSTLSPSPEPPLYLMSHSEQSASQKRRKLESSDDEDGSCPPRKRHRLPFSSDSSKTQLLSPAPSESEVSPELSTSLVSPTSEQGISKKRKRRPSGVDLEPPSKRLQIITSAAPLSTVSYPASEESSLERWLQDQLNTSHCLSDATPEPVSVQLPDDTSSLDVQCYQYEYTHQDSELYPLYSGTLDIDSTSSPVSSLGTLDSSQCDSSGDSSFGSEFQSNVDEVSKANVSALLGATMFQLDDGLNSLSAFDQRQHHLDLPLESMPFPSYIVDSMPYEPQLEWFSLLNNFEGTSVFVPPHEPYGKVPILANCNFDARLVRPAEPLADKIAKQERVQMLREELHRLEADIAL